MKKIIQDLTVCSCRLIGKDYFILGVTDNLPLPEMFPGQFAEIKVDNNPNVFLRRPISIHDVDYEKNILYLLIRIVGEGTQTLSQLKVGDKVNLVYPLGNTFNVEGVRNVLLAGGGCGIAPMLFLARHLHKQKIQVTTLIGGRTSSDILEADEFEKYGKVCVSTDDGTLGEKGFITKNSVLNNVSSFDRLYSCGPLPMMKVFAGIAKENSIDCEVSLENTMACGIGACLCCVTETTHGNKCVCTEGPVFNIKQLIWQI
jgi:dihydroorotate dehydrogenase electron transfer subunit